MKEQLRIFFTALMFYTRLPCPAGTDHSPEYLNKASRFFPLIGWVVGALCFGAYYFSTYIFDQNLSVLFSMLAGVWITGAFHEDGLADTVDGFGGGWTKEQILNIMKDSRIGTYGVFALIFHFAVKFFSLSYLASQCPQVLLLLLIFISFHALARHAATIILFSSTYVRDDEKSKAKPVAKSFGLAEVIGSILFGWTPALVLSWYNPWFFLAIPSSVVCATFMRKYFEKHIVGYTGDCLGATEQISEVIILLAFCIVWKFTF
ncbi:MAG: adenosylcobinamide-GDP ribazoletransferase [Chitinophagales bacterium]|nr:adenosylcobinamide-GDP ribazoletransferase [Chitinophagales bacterium]MDW8273239.1 adenosylcobinamide-GDP ribazoletransferase [Chitinophagales bacterium]